ncbi:MAG: hypothetical protein F6J89_13580 [Symploca sp. SIO1C4]|uniref:Uncharacterized protein n=1 Tax=Symploca sp. SIO1C4 TaxID=2607765 RepID=A0A6B3NCH5_9CYAN|nr:hypothetical protein [Symploca sp. SIO1C4]
MPVEANDGLRFILIPRDDLIDNFENRTEWPRFSCPQANQLFLEFGELRIDNDLTVNSAITTNQLSVNGSVTGSLTVDNDLTVNGAITTNQLSVTSSITTPLTIDNTLTVNSAIATNKLSVTGSITSPLTIDDSLTVNGAVTTNHLNVTGSIMAPLTVEGALNFSTTGTLLFHNTNAAGAPEGDGFRIRYDNNFFGTNVDALVIEKTDGNQNTPDGGIIFANTGKDGIVQSSLVIRGNGNIGIGTEDPKVKLEVNGEIRSRGSSGGILRAYNPDDDRASVFLGWKDNIARIRIGGNGGTESGATNGLDIQSVSDKSLLRVSGQGDLKISGDFQFPNSQGGFAKLTPRKYNNESSFKKNNVKLSLGSGGLFPRIRRILEYEFAVGHTYSSFVARPTNTFQMVTNFVKKFSVNQDGDAYFAGSKGGYVVDYFVNRVGDTLEQGDVVVISKHQVSHYSGSQNNIPIPEVDLTNIPYNSCVCGIVAKVTTEKDLPYVEVEFQTQPEMQPEEIEKLEVSDIEVPHPLKAFAAESKEDLDITKIPDQQMGTMVTLGAFAHCKVDADIAPIQVGDLLTTSSTRGHAQKVLERERTTGAIIGKALQSLAKGKGKIPVLVMLQ